MAVSAVQTRTGTPVSGGPAVALGVDFKEVADEEVVILLLAWGPGAPAFHFWKILETRDPLVVVHFVFK